jgi:hypothetical protein
VTNHTRIGDAFSCERLWEDLDMNGPLRRHRIVDAMRLTRAGRLTEATALLQRMLRYKSFPDTTTAPSGGNVPSERQPAIIDAVDAAKETKGPPSSHLGNSRGSDSLFANARPPILRKLGALPGIGRLDSGLHGLARTAPVWTRDILPEGGRLSWAGAPFGRHAARL